MDTTHKLLTLLLLGQTVAFVCALYDIACVENINPARIIAIIVNVVTLILAAVFVFK